MYSCKQRERKLLKMIGVELSAPKRKGEPLTWRLDRDLTVRKGPRAQVMGEDGDLLGMKLTTRCRVGGRGWNSWLRDRSSRKERRRRQRVEGSLLRKQPLHVPRKITGPGFDILMARVRQERRTVTTFGCGGPLMTSPHGPYSHHGPDCTGCRSVQVMLDMEEELAALGFRAHKKNLFGDRLMRTDQGYL